MQDMVPKSKGESRGDKSIRNIPLPANHRRPAPSSDTQEEDFTEPVLPRKKRAYMKRNPFFWGAIILIVICAVGGTLLSTLFAGATITVTPKSAVVQVPPTIMAAVNPPVGTLAYQVVTTSRTASTSVKASGSAQVSKSATGVITIYNSYSTAPQPLIANTRFQAPDGKIYRIKSAVTVPGAKAGVENSLSPGSVSATVTADAPGADYNKGTTQFTIPGFKNDPRYTKFYAKTDSISGGFVGTQASVAPADLASAQSALKQGLEQALQQAASTQIPKEFISISGTLSITYNDVVQTPGSDSSFVVLSQTASANANTVKATDLASAIAVQKVAGYNGEAVSFKDQNSVTVALAGTSTASTGPLQLTLSGSPTLVWQFDPNALKAALVGKSKSAFEQIVTSFAPAITCSKDTPCSASIRPFWSSTFSSNPDKITIITK